jgi:hypothetical protein
MFTDTSVAEPGPSVIKKKIKIGRKTLILKNDINVPSKSYKQKNTFLLPS